MLFLLKRAQRKRQEGAWEQAVDQYSWIQAQDEQVSGVLDDTESCTCLPDNVKCISPYES